MSAPTGGEGAGKGQLNADSLGHWGVGSAKYGCLHWKKRYSFFFFIIWKCFLSNVNLRFEYSVPDNIRLDCKVYSSLLHPFLIHTPFTYITSFPQKQKLLSNLSVYLYLMGCQLEWTPQNKSLVCCLSIYWN